MVSSTTGVPAVLLGEANWRDAPDAAVRSNLVVVAPPMRDGLAGPRQRLEPVLVEALRFATKRSITLNRFPTAALDLGFVERHSKQT